MAPDTKHPTEEIQSPVKIHILAPSEIATSPFRDDIIELLALGFGHDFATVEGDKIIKDEYGSDDARRRIFLAEVDGKIVGSLYFILWRNQEGDKRGIPMFEHILEKGVEVFDLEKIKQAKMVGCDVGIVVHPEYRGQGVVQEMYKAAVSNTKPVFVVGQTKTPAAVIVRGRAFQELGYSTYFGGLPIHEGDEQVGQLSADAYYRARFDRAARIEGKNIHYGNADGVLLPEINVDLDRLPVNVRTVFEQMIEANKDRPKGQITFGVLISVNDEYLLE